LADAKYSSNKEFRCGSPWRHTGEAEESQAFDQLSCAAKWPTYGLYQMAFMDEQAVWSKGEPGEYSPAAPCPFTGSERPPCLTLPALPCARLA